MIPRDYQAEALAAIDASLQGGVWSQLLVLPTGGGKTVVFAQLPSVLKAFLERESWINRRMLIIAHRDELLEQARHKLMMANPMLAVEIEQGDAYATPMAEVVIASVQTLAARNYERLMKLGPERFKIVVVDEAHHAPAETYQGILERLGVLPPRELLPVGKGAGALHAARLQVGAWWQRTQAQKLLLGVTATPSRSDAVGLEWTFQQVVYEKSLRWMIERKYLVEPRGYVVETGLNLDTVKIVGGDFQQKGLAAMVNTRERNEAIAAAWHDHAVADGVARPTLVFGVDVQHAKDLAAVFGEYNIEAVALDGTASRQERYDTLNAFKRGDVQVLTNCNLFTEGFDEPSIGCIVLARPTKSQALYSQMVGRGLRLFEGKHDCVVLDAVDNCARHSLVTLGDLFGLPPRFDLDGKDAIEVQQRIALLQDRFPTLDIEGVRSLAELDARVRAIDLFKPRQSKMVTDYASMLWIADGERFHIRYKGQQGQADAGQVEIKQGTLGDWTVRKLDATGAYTIGITDDVKDAFALGERWISAHRPDVGALHDKGATWRTRPPTAKQIMKLQEWGCERLPRTRGEASEMLDAYIMNRGRR